MKKIVAGMLSAFIFVAGVTVSTNTSSDVVKIKSGFAQTYNVSMPGPTDPQPE